MLAPALLASGCTSSTSIGDLKRQQAKLVGHEVTVKGTVTNTISGLGFGGFELSDGTGEIWVLTGNARAKGAQVTVTGLLQTAASIPFMGDFGIVIRERDPG